MSGYVLVVDDNPEVHLLLQDILEMAGVKSQKAYNGEQALKIVAENPPAAIILDLMMPVMDGFNTLAHLQGSRSSRKIPVILLSAIADYDHRMQSLPGVVGVMCKARFSIENLLTLLVKAGFQQANI
jgi:CheY-like chemotaxis protein